MKSFKEEYADAQPEQFNIVGRALLAFFLAAFMALNVIFSFLFNKREKKEPMKNKGFTLIELLVIAVILIIIASIARGAYVNLREEREYGRHQELRRGSVVRSASVLHLQRVRGRF